MRFSHRLKTKITAFPISICPLVTNGLNQEITGKLKSITAFISGVWSLEFGVWSLEFGVWSLEFGVWSLEFGVWSLEFGVWSLEFGVGKPDRFQKPVGFKTCSFILLKQNLKGVKNNKPGRFKKLPGSSYLIKTLFRGAVKFEIIKWYCYDNSCATSYTIFL